MKTLQTSISVHDAFRSVFPELQNRTPVTPGAAPYMLASYLPSMFMAYLVRRPGTHLLRLLLLPVVVIAVISTPFRYVWTTPELKLFNWCQCVVAEAMVGKALDFAFTEKGRLKVGEVLPGVMEISRVKNSSSSAHPQSGLWFLPQWLYDPLEVTFAFRGLGWDWEQGVHVPKSTRPSDRSGFVRAAFTSLLKNCLLADLIIALLQMFAGVATSHGRSIFYPHLPPLQRYAISTSIHILTGSALMVGFSISYDMTAIISVIFLQSSPASWPPIMDDPWGSDSLHVFWSTHWHQILRRTFLVLGGYPGQWLAGRTGLVLGSFLASGLFHEAMHLTTGGYDHHGMLFFAIQGPLLIGERLWKKVTGRRVAGWGGRLWVYFCLFVLAQPLVDSWYVRGIGRAFVVPWSISPARLLLLPVTQRIQHHILQSR